jgi:hypothetical protein
MPSVRITTDWHHPERMEWIGAPKIDSNGRIERSLAIPEEAYQRIESAIAEGYLEGDVYLPDRSRFHWFLDR